MRVAEVACMRYSLAEIGRLISGRVHGDPDMAISGLNGIDNAGEHELTFAVPPHLDKVDSCRAAAVIVPPGQRRYSKPVVVVDNPRLAFAELLDVFCARPKYRPGVDRTVSLGEGCCVADTAVIMAQAVIGNNVVIGDGVVIYPHVYVGDDVVIGDGCKLYPQVTVYEGSRLGERVIVHAGTVIGSDGFGYIQIDGRHRKVPQVGNVVIGDDVEIGANSCIDRAATGSTVIGAGSKIDNLVHIAHNVVCGKNCLFVAQVGISGSVTIGDNCTFAGQTGCAGHLRIGDGCLFAARTGITSSVEEGAFMAGYPAMPHRDWLKVQAMRKKVPAMYKRLTEMEEELARLKQLLTTAE
ncbi:MAG: UDP-3-O-(3-hydroxymyristoyl)glucosamine N-acyltransferase [Negativicutes bacterium]|nr:UDP-3-O-(3-hydroxymyristoyl)glucosamine N-acyltransferase [Negativicutes bacterium]